MPSIQPTEIPAKPPSEIWMPVRLGVRPTRSVVGCQSLPIAVGGSAAASSGTERITWATKVLEFGPGQAR